MDGQDDRNIAHEREHEQELQLGVNGFPEFSSATSKDPGEPGHGQYWPEVKKRDYESFEELQLQWMLAGEIIEANDCPSAIERLQSGVVKLHRFELFPGKEHQPVSTHV